MSDKMRLLLVVLAYTLALQCVRIDAAAIICGGDSAPARVQLDATTDEKSLESEETTTTTTTEASDVTRLVRKLQCGLEKAKPWMAEIETEAKRLEVKAKRFGEGVISSLTEFVDKIIGDDGGILAKLFSVAGNGGGGSSVKKDNKNENVLLAEMTVTTEGPDDFVDIVQNEILPEVDKEKVQLICPEGFKAAGPDVCQRINN